MHRCMQGPWGRLFENWERLFPGEDGWEGLGDATPAGLKKSPAELLRMALRVLWHTIKEAPEVAARRRKKKTLI